MHAGFLHHYLQAGAYYPRGGGQVIGAHLTDVVQSYGGRVRTKARVEQILIEDGRATGVRLQGGEEIRAEVVVSAADFKKTWACDHGLGMQSSLRTVTDATFLIVDSGEVGSRVGATSGPQCVSFATLAQVLCLVMAILTSFTSYIGVGQRLDASRDDRPVRGGLQPAPVAIIC